MVIAVVCMTMLMIMMVPVCVSMVMREYLLPPLLFLWFNIMTMAKFIVRHLVGRISTQLCN